MGSDPIENMIYIVIIAFINYRALHKVFIDRYSQSLKSLLLGVLGYSLAIGVPSVLWIFPIRTGFWELRFAIWGVTLGYAFLMEVAKIDIKEMKLHNVEFSQNQKYWDRNSDEFCLVQWIPFSIWSFYMIILLELRYFP